MLAENSTIYCALITIECATPMSIKGDEADLSIDTSLLRDANGFPLIPGTSIAGVLRSIARTQQLDHLFGSTQGDEKDIHPSQLEFSFGFCHNSDNKPMIGLEAKAQSRVEQQLLNLMPIMRDQVALNEYGSAIDGAKLDRSAVPKGTRFSFEITWSTDKEDSERWSQILGWLAHPDFRLGGLTQRGFGKIKIVQLLEQRYSLKDKESFKKWQHHRSPAQLTPFKAASGKSIPIPTVQTNDKDITFSLSLEAEDFWRIGQGNLALGEMGVDFDKDPNIKPYTETTIEWKGDSAEIKEQQLVIPATGIKGALRHRTLFHLRRLNNDFADGIDKQCETSNSDLKSLFGDSADEGQVGSVQFDDIYDISGVQKNGKYITKVMMHNKIDRFTGGTIDGALFSEELLYGGQFTLTGRIKHRTGDNFVKTQNQLKAFKMALEDIAKGRLALGGGSTKGHGYFCEIESDFSQLEQAIQQVSQQA